MVVGIEVYYADNNWLREHRYTLMQYTGLKDKNGKEIYEGDVVKNGYGDNQEVTFGEWNCGECSDVYGYQFDAARSRENDSLILEVIGNKYENPELLKDI